MDAPISSEEPSQLLKASDVAKILNVSRAFAYKLMKTGELRSVQIMGAVRVRPQDLNHYVNNNLQPPVVS